MSSLTTVPSMLRVAKNLCPPDRLWFLVLNSHVCRNTMAAFLCMSFPRLVWEDCTLRRLRRPLSRRPGLCFLLLLITVTVDPKLRTLALARESARAHTLSDQALSHVCVHGPVPKANKPEKKSFQHFLLTATEQI